VIDAIAIAAARAVMSGEATGTPKSDDGAVEALRTLNPDPPVSSRVRV
jgi:hypothetical protein